MCGDNHDGARCRSCRQRLEDLFGALLILVGGRFICKEKDGCETTARAIATRWRSPPERLRTILSASGSTLSLLSAAKADRRHSFRPPPRGISGNRTFSTALRSPNSRSCWKTMPTLRRQRSRCELTQRETASPSTTTSPWTGRSRPAKTCSRVLLPEPVAPDMTAICPVLKCADRSSITSFSLPSGVRRATVSRRH